MENQNKWQLAAIDGLILSSVTIITMLLSSILGEKPNFIVSMLIWIVKFGGSLYLLYYLMKKYSNNFDTISYGQSFSYGFLVCVFSSIVCACFGYVLVEFLFPEQTEMAIAQTRQMLGSTPGYTEDVKETMNKILGNYSWYMLFGQLIYLTIFGAIASSITANYTKKTNPFTDSQTNQEEQE